MLIFNQQGKVVWRGHSGVLNEDIIQKVLQDTTYYQNKPKSKISKKNGDVSFWLEKSSLQDKSLDWGEEIGSVNNESTWKLDGINWSLMNLVGFQLLKKYPFTRVMNKQEDIYINFEFTCNPQKYKKPQKLLLDYLKLSFNFEYQEKNEVKNVWVLDVLDGEKLSKYQIQTNKSWFVNGEEYFFKGNSLQEVCKALEVNENEIFMYQGTNIKFYNINFPVFDDVKILNKTLKKYGIQFSRKREKIEVLEFIFR